jgi:hypothetical protein
MSLPHILLALSLHPAANQKLIQHTRILQRKHILEAKIQDKQARSFRLLPVHKLDELLLIQASLCPCIPPVIIVIVIVIVLSGSQSHWKQRRPPRCSGECAIQEDILTVVIP